MSKSVLTEIGQGVKRIIINRPDRRNALDRESLFALREAVEESGGEEDVRALVLTGTSGAFSAGADLKEGAAKEDLIESWYNPLIRAIYHLPKPVIAAVDGVAAGFGCSLALACDLRLVSERARFSPIFVRIGLTLDGGASYFLPRLVGLRAMELALTGELIDAQEAYRLGLANRVYPVDTFEGEVAQYAQRLAKGAPLALAAIKGSIHRALNGSVEEILEHERLTQRTLLTTEDFREGAIAFLQKREPIYKGR